MNNDEQYVPDEQDLEVAWIESEASADDINVASAEFGRFLARVRRDAAREAEARIEAVQHLIDQADEMGEWAITCTRLQWAVDGSAPPPRRMTTLPHRTVTNGP